MENEQQLEMPILTVSATEFKRHFGKYAKIAKTRPISVTMNNRPLFDTKPVQNTNNLQELFDWVDQYHKKHRSKADKVWTRESAAKYYKITPEEVTDEMLYDYYKVVENQVRDEYLERKHGKV